MIKSKQYRKPSIDLSGTQGNAFYIMGQAKNLLKELKRYGVYQYLDKDQTYKDFPSEKEIIEEMMSSDYENLIQTFDKYFSEYVDLERWQWDRIGL